MTRVHGRPMFFSVLRVSLCDHRFRQGARKVNKKNKRLEPFLQRSIKCRLT